jgi:hypothetical protein
MCLLDRQSTDFSFSMSRKRAQASRFLPGFANTLNGIVIAKRGRGQVLVQLTL